MTGRSCRHPRRLAPDLPVPTSLAAQRRRHPPGHAVIAARRLSRACWPAPGCSTSSSPGPRWYRPQPELVSDPHGQIGAGHQHPSGPPAARPGHPQPRHPVARHHHQRRRPRPDRHPRIPAPAHPQPRHQPGHDRDRRPGHHHHPRQHPFSAPVATAAAGPAPATLTIQRGIAPAILTAATRAAARALARHHADTAHAAARLRPRHRHQCLPAAAKDPRARRRQGQDLPVRPLRAAGLADRPRPHIALAQRRPHLQVQSRRLLPDTPFDQAPARLAPRTTPTRHLPLDHPSRTHLPRPARPLPRLRRSKVSIAVGHVSPVSATTCSAVSVAATILQSVLRCPVQYLGGGRGRDRDRKHGALAGPDDVGICPLGRGVSCEDRGDSRRHPQCAGSHRGCPAPQGPRRSAPLDGKA